MLQALLGKITNNKLVSRYEQLAVAMEAVIDSVTHAGDLLPRGTVLAKIVASGKYRAYAEGNVTGAAIAINSPNFTVDPTQSVAAWFKQGDVIESVGGLAIGTILSYSPATGAVVLTANATNALAAGQAVRIAAASFALSGKQGRILQDDVGVTSVKDEVVSAYVEGFFHASGTDLTTAAATAMNAITVSTDEVRI